MGAPEKARDATRQADMSNSVQAMEAGRLDNKSLSKLAAQQNLCLSSPLPAALTAFKEYFGGGTIPGDPDPLQTVGGCGAGEYAFAIYKTADSTKLYGIFSKVEKVANANMLCANVVFEDPKINEDDVSACEALDNCCYGVTSK